MHTGVRRACYTAKFYPPVSCKCSFSRHREPLRNHFMFSNREILSPRKFVIIQYYTTSFHSFTLACPFPHSLFRWLALMLWRFAAHLAALFCFYLWTLFYRFLPNLVGGFISITFRTSLKSIIFINVNYKQSYGPENVMKQLCEHFWMSIYYQYDYPILTRSY